MSTPSHKGSFGRAPRRADLPLSKRYLVPGPRRTMLLGGLAVGVVVMLLIWLDVARGGGDWISGGPLSSAHATLDASCSSCHGDSSFDAVADTACTACHEASGAFTFETHAARRPTSGMPRTFDPKPTCTECHDEHQGRPASLVAVLDGQCLACHQTHRFDRDHPEFAFTKEPDSDDDALHFAHGRHVKEVLKRTGWDDPQRTCLTCHQPDDDVRDFAPIDFDLHCASCHLGTGVATARLPVDSGREEKNQPGVWTLERIRAANLPGTDWAFYMAPGDFRGAGSRVAKIRLEHEDPWILFNLRRLRQLRYGDAGVADLLVATPGATKEGSVYDEAVASLEAQAEALRGSSDPAVQDDLTWIEGELARIRSELADPSTKLAGVELPDASSSLSHEQESAWDELVADLSAQCTTCHTMDRATLVAIESDQRVLSRAEFSHAPHVGERACLDCHAKLPILEALEATGDALDALETWDRAEVHNLPGIATCRECHGQGQVASACVACHSFHPDSASKRARQLVQYGTADLAADRQETSPGAVP